jgi:hypothetical protein
VETGTGEVRGVGSGVAMRRGVIGAWDRGLKSTATVLGRYATGVMA